MSLAFRLLAAVAACLLGTGVASAQDTGTLRKVKDSGAIAIGVREGSSPFSYHDGKGQYIGYSVDICIRIVDVIKTQLKLPNLKVTWVSVTPDSRIPMLLKGAIDLECGSTTNSLERQKQVGFVVTTFFTGTRLLVKTASNIKSYKDLRGKTVAVTSGTTNEQAIRKIDAQDNLGMNFISVKDHIEAFQAVESGRAAAFPMDDVLLYTLRANARTPVDFAVVGDFLTDEPYAIMLRKDDAALKKLADSVVVTMFKSGEISRLYGKWFESPIPPKGANLNMPMSDMLKDDIKNPNDKGVDKCGRMKCLMYLPSGV